MNLIKHLPLPCPLFLCVRRVDDTVLFTNTTASSSQLDRSSPQGTLCTLWSIQESPSYGGHLIKHLPLICFLFLRVRRVNGTVSLRNTTASSTRLDHSAPKTTPCRSWYTKESLIIGGQATRSILLNRYVDTLTSAT